MLGGVKSAVGIGTLLAEGIGDTIRVSLTDDPAEEVKVGTTILRSLGPASAASISPRPPCGRGERARAHAEGERCDREGALQRADAGRGDGLRRERAGEAREADVGIASGNGLGFIIRQGEVVAKVPRASSSTPCSPRRAPSPPRRPPPASVPTSPNLGAANGLNPPTTTGRYTPQ